MKFGRGGSLSRPEDPRLLTGDGRYLDDLVFEGLSHAAFVRSPHAHARIIAVDTVAAAASPGVLAVYTGKDLVEKHGLGAVPFRQFPPIPQATPLTPPPRYPLMPDIVRYVGDNVAMVVAETLEQAHDAAELVDVAYQVLEGVTDPAAAVAAGSPQIWPDAPNNVAGAWAQGDEAAVDAAIAAAAHVTEIELVNNRLVPNSMETRGCACVFDGETGRYTMHIGVQMPHLLKTHLCEDVFHIAEDWLRVLVPDIGGGFGMKVFCYPEYACVMFAAGQLGRPVRWRSARSEAFISDIHGRDQVNRAQLAFDGDGKIVAMKAQSLGNMGVYIAYHGAFLLPSVRSASCPTPMTSRRCMANVNVPRPIAARPMPCRGVRTRARRSILSNACSTRRLRRCPSTRSSCAGAIWWRIRRRCYDERNKYGDLIAPTFRARWT